MWYAVLEDGGEKHPRRGKNMKKLTKVVAAYAGYKAYTGIKRDLKEIKAIEAARLVGEEVDRRAQKKAEFEAGWDSIQKNKTTTSDIVFYDDGINWTNPDEAIVQHEARLAKIESDLAHKEEMSLEEYEFYLKEQTDTKLLILSEKLKKETNERRIEADKEEEQQQVLKIVVSSIVGILVFLFLVATCRNLVF